MEAVFTAASLSQALVTRFHVSGLVSLAYRDRPRRDTIGLAPQGSWTIKSATKFPTNSGGRSETIDVAKGKFRVKCASGGRKR